MSVRADLADQLRTADDLHSQTLSYTHEQAAVAAAYDHVVAANLHLQRELEAARDQLKYLQVELEFSSSQLILVQGSLAWRMTDPLRRLARRHPVLASAARTMMHIRRRMLAVRRRVKNWLLQARTLRLPRRVMAQLRHARTMWSTRSVVEARDPAESTAVFRLRSIAGEHASAHCSSAKRRRLLCVTHVVPYPMQAGNGYRIERMLSWLAAQEWEVLLVVCPLPGDTVSEKELSALTSKDINFIVCGRDGTLLHSLVDGDPMLRGLRGMRTRTFSFSRQEHLKAGARELDALCRTICPDVLIELLLHLETQFAPHALLAEYVFMARSFGLLQPGLLKIIDTHDVFSTRQVKAARYGIEGMLAIDPDLEAELLNRGDVLIAIQDEEASALRALSPTRKVISVGVDFAVLDSDPPWPQKRSVLLVASSNEMNIKGLNDFLRFAWPGVLARVPDAELRIIGTVGEVVHPVHPNVAILGRVDNLANAYAEARVAINPAVAGTGLKIKTVEALCHLRPIVVWPNGADGLRSDVRQLCRTATDWYDFGQQVVDLLLDDTMLHMIVDQRPNLAACFAREVVYAPLDGVLEQAITHSREARGHA